MDDGEVGDRSRDELEAAHQPRTRRRRQIKPMPLLPGEPTLSEVLQQMRDEDDR